MKDEQLQQAVRQLLQADAEQMDEQVTLRLAAARRRAVAASATRTPWPQLAGWAFAASVLLAVGVGWQLKPTEPGLKADDFELLMSTEALELYEDWEFYAWLATANDAS